MSLNWQYVSKLVPPIQTTEDDVVLSGHGSLSLNEQGETLVPEGVELWLLSPPGASIADATGQALENTTLITKLGMKSPGNDVLSNTTPIRYTQGQSVPDYTLHPPRGIVLKPGGPHLLGVEQATPLSALWPRVVVFVKPGRTTKVWWAACTAIDGASNPVVLYK